MPLQEVGAANSRALQDIADAITKSHKVLVVTGAGISTSCGIPDFRSKDGLYNLIPQESLLPTPPPSEPSTPRHKRKASAMDDDLEPPSSQSSTLSRASRVSNSSPASRMRGQDLFHARVFQNGDTTEVFYKFVTSLRQKIKDDVKDTSLTHKFIRTLRDGGRLMRCYTQNIDGLEAREGLCLDLARGKGNKRRFMKKHIEAPRPENTRGTDFDGGCEVVQLHGELTNLRCTMCSTEEPWSDEKSAVLLQGHAPKCEECDLKSQLRLATGKRGLTVGGLRPNIVLYGEEHPQNTLLSPFVPYDIASNPDLLIIMGTSLKVHGLQKIIRDFAKAVHTQKNGRVVFVNRTRPAESVWDGIIDDFVEMDCDDWVSDLRRRREDLWLRQGELDLKLVKSITGKRKRKSTDDVPQGPSEGPVVKKVAVQHHSRIIVDIPRVDTSIKSKNSTRPRSSNKKPPQRSTVQEQGESKIEPKSSSSTGWRRSQIYDTPTRNLLSPLKRANRPLTASPITPIFSPLTPRSSKATNALLCATFTRTPSKLRSASMMIDAENTTIEHEAETENDSLSERRNQATSRVKATNGGMDVREDGIDDGGDDECEDQDQDPDPNPSESAATTNNAQSGIMNARSFVRKLIPGW